MAFAISEILKQTKLQVTIKAPNQYRGKHHLSFTASNSVHPQLSTFGVGDRPKISYHDT